MIINCLIIDDEPLAINVIKNHIKEIDNINVIDTFNSAIDALNFMKSNTVDLLFLDINMPLLDGLDFIKSLDKKPMIVITTAYSEYAIKTYELEVLDYLMKPISFPRFLKAVNRAFKELNSNLTSNLKVAKRAHIFIKVDKKKMQKIYLDEILIIESLRDYLKITTISNKYIIHSTLSSFTEKLPYNNFIRIHRSFTIAIDKIEAVQGNSVEIDGIKYVIGRSYIEHVKNRILQ
ncbi:LytTR family DNA-binding domain-containing protein [Flavobacteriaceae bacterium]|nr:LytTR family DNA-binding domain-containing protein [Flavobacteriaceae bacterium]MDB2684785.1 LytTR family DNA-binding domain-containing protein [Flavobacteriaceae bacterium]MDC0331254.1 LytTR family DNA-binding domain-containing protein [Flavobacteriaceae bacterium]MDC0636482.1 LytTR family DNA-binding domain-containing protein [Flavobacteriaceae bacterium]